MTDLGIIRRLRDAWYHKELRRLVRRLVPPGARVLDLGCGYGDLLMSLAPSKGIGVDNSAAVVREAKRRHAEEGHLTFLEGNIEAFPWDRLPESDCFDYVVCTDVLPLLNDVQRVLENVRTRCARHTRMIVTFHSNLWRPLLSLATAMGLRARVPDRNWLSRGDVENILRLAGYEPIRFGMGILLPVYLPILSWIANRILVHLPLVRDLALCVFVVARLAPRETEDEKTVSVIVPTKNERGNVEGVFRRTPQMGKWTELVFVDGASEDGTPGEIRRCIQAYANEWKRARLFTQSGKGKGQAVFEALDGARGDIVMILDSDLTMPPEELPKYYRAITEGTGEFVNGCRLVYPMEGKSMRFLNMLANYAFTLLISWLLGQRVKDTLCGTKVLWRDDYERMMRFCRDLTAADPFGDFGLLFGAAKLNLRIVDMPIRYRARTYGEIQIHRWSDGLRLLRTCALGLVHLKLR